MKKFLLKLSGILIFIAIGYFSFIYFVSYSEGIRAGELIKFSHKGVIVKTWEGKISQGVSDELSFIFSVEGKETKVIEDLQRLQGKHVKLYYFEGYSSFFWLGDTKYFITKVEENTERNNAQY